MPGSNHDRGGADSQGCMNPTSLVLRRPASYPSDQAFDISNLALLPSGPYPDLDSSSLHNKPEQQHQTSRLSFSGDIDDLSFTQPFTLSPSANGFQRPALPGSKGFRKSSHDTSVPVAGPWSPMTVTGAPFVGRGQSGGSINHKLKTVDSALGTSISSLSRSRPSPSMASSTAGSQYLGDEAPQVRMQHVLPDMQAAVPSIVIQDQGSLESEVLYCSICNTNYATKSEFTKHMARHDKRHKCTVPGCKKQDGFATLNDLDRHNKSVHKQLGPDDQVWKCFVDNCRSAGKIWPRQDNFKAHIERSHKGVDVEEHLRLAEQWWERVERPRKLAEEDKKVKQAELSASLDSDHLGVSKYSRPQRQHLTTDQFPSVRSNMADYPLSIAGDVGSNQGYSAYFDYTVADDARGIMPPSSPYLMSQTGQESVSIAADMSRHASNNFDLSPSMMETSTNHDVNNRPLLAHRVELELMNKYSIEGTSGHVMPQYEWDTMTAPPAMGHRGENIYSDYQSNDFGAITPVGDTSAFMPRTDDSNFAFMGNFDATSVSIPVSDDLAPDIVSPPSTGNGMSIAMACDSKADRAEEIRQQVAQVLRRFDGDTLAKSVEQSVEKLIRDHLNGQLVNQSSTQKGLASTTGSQAPTTDRPFKCSRKNCDKSFEKQNACVKHEKRHDRMYFCTYDECFKCFGTKQDLQRHEHTCNSQEESWRCWSTPKAREKNKSCAHLTHDKQQFEKHRREHHTPKRPLEEFKVEKNHAGNFWCGFCNRVVENPVSGGTNGTPRMNFRYQHIENHIKKGTNMSQWYELGGNGDTKAQRREAAGQQPKPDDDDEGSSEEDSPKEFNHRTKSGQSTRQRSVTIPGTYSPQFDSHMQSSNQNHKRSRQVAGFVDREAGGGAKFSRFQHTQSVGNAYTMKDAVASFRARPMDSQITIQQTSTPAYIKCCTCHAGRQAGSAQGHACQCSHLVCRQCLCWDQLKRPIVPTR